LALELFAGTALDTTLSLFLVPLVVVLVDVSLLQVFVFVSLAFGTEWEPLLTHVFLPDQYPRLVVVSFFLKIFSLLYRLWTILPCKRQVQFGVLLENLFNFCCQ